MMTPQSGMTNQELLLSTTATGKMEPSSFHMKKFTTQHSLMKTFSSTQTIREPTRWSTMIEPTPYQIRFNKNQCSGHSRTQLPRLFISPLKSQERGNSYPMIANLKIEMRKFCSLFTTKLVKTSRLPTLPSTEDSRNG